MSSPIQHTQVTKNRPDLRAIDCAACQAPLQGGRIEINYHRLVRIVCPLCGQDYVLCPTCGRLSTFYPTGDWVSCCHCRQGFLHAGSSLIPNMSKEQAQAEERERVRHSKLKRLVKERYRNPVGLLPFGEAGESVASGGTQKTPWWKALFSKK